MLTLPLFALGALVLGQLDPTGILFIRGGSGTSGEFIGSGEDDQLSDINDFSTAVDNHGWGELAQLLEGEGFTLTQVVEGPATNNTPIDLAALDLSQYAVIVFGSNNAAYGDAEADLLADWVCGGGSALFISDAAWGLDWGDAPTSDQPFLDRFDLVMNQDQFEYLLQRSESDFVVAGQDMGAHPVLAGPDMIVGDADDVDIYDGEGVSPITVVDALENVDPIVLAKAEIGIKVNDDPSGGTIRPPTDADGALVVLEYGTGRVAGQYDRNTFFNANGAGTDINRWDNAQYATHLFNWLADAPGPIYGEGCQGPNMWIPRLYLEGCPRRGESVELQVRRGPGGATAVFVFGLGPGNASFPNGCPLLVSPLLPLYVPVALSGSGPGQGSIDVTLTIPPDASPGTLAVQVLIPDGAINGGMGVSNAVMVTVF